MIHDLSGTCLSCAQIFNRYPGFQEELKTWFQALQIEHPEAHISSAGRGYLDQMSLFHRGASKARWLQSAHNFNQAIDLWELRKGVYTLDPIWFQKVVKANLYPKFKWYGEPGSPYFELPHIEISDWREQVKNGIAIPVESFDV